MNPDAPGLTLLAALVISTLPGGITGLFLGVRSTSFGKGLYCTLMGALSGPSLFLSAFFFYFGNTFRGVVMLGFAAFTIYALVSELQPERARS